MLTGPKTPEYVAPFHPVETCESTEAHEEALNVPEEALLFAMIVKT